MPNSVEKAFQYFADSLVLPGEHLKAAIEKSNRVGEWAKRKIKSNGSFFGGSYRRGTILPQESLKFHILLGQKHFFDCNENSTKLLFFLKKRLTEDFSSPTVSEGGMVVRLKSTTAVDLDLVPTIKLSRGGYLAPNGQGGWYKTNPGKEEIIFKRKEELSSGRFLKLVKIMKAWNLHAGLPFNVYFLELLAYYRVNDFIKPYAELVHSLFASMRLFLPEFLNCPAIGEVVSSGSNSAARQKVLGEACGLSAKAVSENNPEKALLIWKSMMGDSFRGINLKE